MLVDEINRGNISRILGELLFVLEYRDKQVRLAYSKPDEAPFSVPPNVVVLGTMNTTDRSLTQIDYARAMAFMALDKDEKELLGVARLAADPNYDAGEYAIIVRSDIKGSGIGWLLMRQLIRYAEREGLQELTGDVLEHNTRMLDMCRALGFEITTDPEDVSIRKVRLKLPSQLRDAA